MFPPDIRHQLRQAGLRVTAPRECLLQWLFDHPHATAEQIRTGVAQRLGSVSTQTVYDVLAACTAAGLVRRIEPAGHPARFERRTGDNHHHVVCRSCGRAEDVDCAVDVRPCLTPSDDHGYQLDEAEVVFWGICPACLVSPHSAHQEAAQ
ncbi:MAG TPA: Fur family transcriptional regulator [Pseudonocardiaceae bacterium]|jgi:Fur family ferric uptake transcriptional regulator